jgi:hypothetical protein
MRKHEAGTMPLMEERLGELDPIAEFPSHQDKPGTRCLTSSRSSGGETVEGISLSEISRLPDYIHCFGWLKVA